MAGHVGTEPGEPLTTVRALEVAYEAVDELGREYRAQPNTSSRTEKLEVLDDVRVALARRFIKEE